MSRQPTGIRNIPRSKPKRDAVPPLLLALALAIAPLSAHAGESGALDPEFQKYPLTQWASSSTQTHLRWGIDIPAPQLSTHQRLMMRIVTRVDGREIEKRRAGKGFMTLIQIRDAEGHLWQNHAELDLRNIHQNVNQSDFTFSYYAFVLPGDYTVTAAVCDTVTMEHSVSVRKVHVASPHSEPFPAAWNNLPPVEFITSVEGPPDVWFLPEIENRLHITVKTSRPVHLQILVNTTPSELAAASITTVRRNMSLAIPAMKLLSQLQFENGRVDTALLDLTHRRIPFEQKQIDHLDWTNMRRFFADAQPAMVDVATLQGQWKMRPFFWDEVTRRLQPHDGEIPIVIVLSGPAFLGDQQAIETSLANRELGQRLFYVRYRYPTVNRPQRVRVRPGMKPPPHIPELEPMALDDLERTLEPLGPHIFDATSPDQFRRVLAAILDHISKL